jgi:hypothetical protein
MLDVRTMKTPALLQTYRETLRALYHPDRTGLSGAEVAAEVGRLSRLSDQLEEEINRRIAWG